MAIPILDAEGFLPTGIFDCSFSEVRDQFGRFQGSDARPKLFTQLEILLATMRNARLFRALLIDGSFCTAKTNPNDIDLIAVLKPGHDFERDLPMSEYGLVSRTLLRRRFGFDVIVAEEASSLYKTYVEFFSCIRDNPEKKKGLLRLTL